MKIGMFSNSARTDRQVPHEDFDSDLAEIIVGDRLGFEEVWISEHLGSVFKGAMTAPELLIAKAAGLTERIRLGTAVRLLPLFHPFDVATQAAVNDNLSNGRYNLGVGAGFPLPENYARRGLDIGERVPRTLESFEFLQRCFTSTEPFDFDGEFFTARNVCVAPRPMQHPLPVSVASSSEMLRVAGAGGHGLLLGHFEPVRRARRSIADYVAHAERANVADPHRNIRLARLIMVADDAREAEAAMRAWVEEDLRQRRAWVAGGIAPNPFSAVAEEGETIDDMHFDLLAERGAFSIGTPDEVARDLTVLYDDVGGFGTLLYVTGKDMGTWAQRQRSLELFAAEVAPRLPTPEANAAEAALAGNARPATIRGGR
ncbi:MAG: LLM class flavin-dependent oxidoreductase [Acidimicrobiia bacterium]